MFSPFPPFHSFPSRSSTCSAAKSVYTLLVREMSTIVTVTNTDSDDGTSDGTVETSSSGNERMNDVDADKLQRQLFDAIRTRDASTVRALLDGPYDVDVNCKDYRGVTGLNLAIEIGDEPMVDVLLARPGLDVGDSLMYAIRGGRYLVVEKLLNAIVGPDGRPPGCGAQPAQPGSIEFPRHLTPLVLAAQCGHINVIGLLLSRGHTLIETPHEPRCSCKEVRRGRLKGEQRRPWPYPASGQTNGFLISLPPPKKTIGIRRPETRN